MLRRRGGRPTVDLYAVAGALRREFRRGHNMRVTSGGAVHRVRLEEGLGGVQLPGPACRVGVAGYRPDQVQATAEAVTCGRCHHLRAAEPVLGEDAPVQLALIS